MARVSFRQGEARPVDGLGYPVTGAELHVQVVDFKEQPVNRFHVKTSARECLSCHVETSVLFGVEGVLCRLAKEDECQHRQRQE